MSEPVIVAVTGMPATGKTILFRELIKRTGGQLSWRWDKAPFAHHRHSKSGAVILGDYSAPASPTADFAGTDRLSMSVQKKALEFCRLLLTGDSCPAILFEGDRLGNNSFLDGLKPLTPRLYVVELFAGAEVLKRRHADRKDTQTEGWLSGRETKLANIRRARPVERRPNTNQGQLAGNAAYILRLAGLLPPAAGE